MQKGPPKNTSPLSNPIPLSIVFYPVAPLFPSGGARTPTNPDSTGGTPAFRGPKATAGSNSRQAGSRLPVAWHASEAQDLGGGGGGLQAHPPRGGPWR